LTGGSFTAANSTGTDLQLSGNEQSITLTNNGGSSALQSFRVSKATTVAWSGNVTLGALDYTGATDPGTGWTYLNGTTYRYTVSGGGTTGQVLLPVGDDTCAGANATPPTFCSYFFYMPGGSSITFTIQN
jgi:hypothetical protein